MTDHRDAGLHNGTDSQPTEYISQQENESPQSGEMQQFGEFDPAGARWLSYRPVSEPGVGMPSPNEVLGGYDAAAGHHAPRMEGAGQRRQGQSYETPVWSERVGQAESQPVDWLDDLRSAELVPVRKPEPQRGWRRAVLNATFGLVNPGPSADEHRQAELEAHIRSPLRGRYKIGVLGKGGVGKTAVAAGVGSIFAELRNDDRVVAIDADTSFGKLASRIDPNTSGSYWDLAADERNTFADIRNRVGSNKSGLFVLAGEAVTARRRVLDPATYHEAIDRLDQHFTISIVDCGSTLDLPVTQTVLDDVDALVVVATPWSDGATAAGQTLGWLANQERTDLLRRTVVVLNDADGHSQKRNRAMLVEHFSKNGLSVVELRHDKHLRPGGVIDVFGQLHRTTRRQLMHVAALIAANFTANTDRPRERR